MSVTSYICEHLDIKDYYDNYIQPLNTKRFDTKFKDSTLVVCPLHNDHDPSMGIVRDKRNRKILRYHCFGCGKSGDIINLYQETQRLNRKRNISYNQAGKELADLYKLDLSQMTEDEKDNSYRRELQRGSENVKRILDSGKMSPRDYTRGVSKLIAMKSSMLDTEDLASKLDSLNVEYKNSRMVEGKIM